MAPIRRYRLALWLASALVAAPLVAQEEAPSGETNASLEEQFRDPPNAARPRVWWHWMNGNVTKDGIAKDLAWMKRVGIGGMQNFDANLQTPQIVDKRLVYMTPDWKDAFRFAAQEADRLGLELAIAASPGWSETGGPWVKPEDGLKKVVWSETLIEGGRRFRGVIAEPPRVTGPFQTMGRDGTMTSSLSGVEVPEPPEHYSDIAVLAIPVPAIAKTSLPVFTDGAGNAVESGALSDADFETAVSLTKPAEGAAVLLASFEGAQTIRSARLHMPGGAQMFSGPRFLPSLEASQDGVAWRKVVEIPVTPVPTTVGFEPVTARHFRLVFEPIKSTGLSWDIPEGIDPGPMAKMGEMLAKAPIAVGDFRLSGDQRIDMAETKAAFALVPDYFALDGRVADAPGIAARKVVDLTSRMQADGSLDWSPPEGTWRVIRMGWSLLGTTNHPATPEATGLEVDKFDAAAVRRYLEHYIGIYKDAAGENLVGKRGVRAILTDSIEVGASNWTSDLIAKFRQLRGYDPTPWLPTLTGAVIGSREQSDGFLFDFRRTLADLVASAHYGTVAEVAHENDLIVYGEALEAGRPSIGDDIAMRSHADIPMAAMWTHSRERGPQGSHVVDDKGASSTAHIYGRKYVAAESMTAAMSPWSFAPADLKRIIDLEFTLGINRPVIHTSVHVPVEDKKPGLSLFIFGQYFNRNESWAELARPWIDYIARNSLLLQHGRNVADVAYYYGEEAPLTGLYAETPVADAPTRFAYDFVNHDALMNALGNEGGVLTTPGTARYGALYLGGSSRHMTLATLRRIAELAEGGATIVGLAPLADPSLGEDSEAYSALVAKLWSGAGTTPVGKGQVIASNDIEAALGVAGIKPDFHFTGASDDAKIPFVHRRTPEGEGYFLVNRSGRPQSIAAHFRVTGKAPELWDAVNGSKRSASFRIENGETIVPIMLGVDDSIHVLFTEDTSAASREVPEPSTEMIGEIKGPWTVSFQENRGAPSSIAMKSLARLDKSTQPGVRYFSGTASYKTTFSAPEGWVPGQPAWIDLGEAHDVAQVWINGSEAGTVWRSPYRLDVGSLLRKGSNAIEVRVANRWVNRLVGDAQPGATKVTWTALPTYRADAPLLPSGLVGPVQILGSRSN